MDDNKKQSLFNDKYQKLLSISYQEWLKTAPQTEGQAYARLNEIDRELHRTYDLWFEAKGAERDQWEDYRDKLKAEYDFLEQMFNLEAPDKNW